MSDLSVADAIRFESEIDVHSLHYLRDHRVRGEIVLPATAYMEMALAAGREVFERESCALDEVDFQQPLILLEEDSRIVRLELSTNGDEGMSFRIQSLPALTQSPEITHVAGKILARAPHTDPVTIEQEPLAEIRARCLESISPTLYYQQLEEHGLEYGPAFQGLTQIWSGAGEALACVELPAALETDAELYYLHPALLDASFQVIAAAFTAAEVRNADSAYVPVGVKSLRVHQRPSARLWSHVRLNLNPDGASDTFEAEVRLLDESGRLLVEVSGLRLQRLRSGAERATSPVSGWIYELCWRPQPRVLAAPQTKELGNWLIFADQNGLGESLAQLLTARGATSTLVFPGASYREPTNGRCYLNSSSAEDYKLLVSDIFGAQGSVSGIVHLWSLDAVSTMAATVASLKDAVHLGCVSVLHLVQVLAAQGLGPDAPRLYLVTRGAQLLEGDIAELSVAQSPLWGFGKTLILEQSDLQGCLLDLDPLVPANEASLLLDEISHPDEEDQVALRKDQRYVARLVHSHLLKDGSSATRFSDLRADACYLITGGMGALGLEVARHLVAHGARHLILLGRTTLPPRFAWESVAEDSPKFDAIKTILELERSGASISVASFDVADEESLTSFIEEYRREQRPLIRGIVHAAGMLRDGVIAQMDEPALSEVLRPKVLGGWLLHKLFEDEPLDFFVLFSSAASLLGAPGQANYSAANSFLDALAQLRRRQGQPALSINWGPWSGRGMAARTTSARFFSGLGLIEAGKGIEAFARLLSSDAVHVGVLPVDWAEFFRTHPQAQRSRFLSILLSDHAASSPAESANAGAGAWRRTLLAATATKRRILLREYLRAQVAQVLELPPSELDVQQPLSAAGLDSLMAIDLKNRLDAELGLIIPIRALLEGPSVEQFGEALLELLAKPVEGQKLELEPVVKGIREFPLSRGQQALWLLNQLAPQDTAYNVGEAALIHGKLDVNHLRAAFQKLVDRHPSLRTTFRSADGIPLQQVHEVVEVCFREEDVGNLDRPAIEKLLTSEIERPFDLEEGPLLRVFVYRLSSQEHILLLVLHHIIEDFWSLIILMQELGALYAAETGGPSAALPQLKVQYGDYILWQERMLESAVGNGHWAYWADHLVGELPALNLPTDHPRPPVKTYVGSTHYFNLGESLTRSFHDFCQAQGVTAYTALLTTFFVLLHQYTGQEDIVVGSPAAGRTRPELSNIIGYFDNPLPLRAKLSSSLPFADFLAQVRQSVLGGLDHQDFPFPTIVERKQPPRDLSRSPLFDVMFVLRKAQSSAQQGLTAFSLGDAGATVTLGNLRVESVSLGLKRNQAQFDLTLAVAEVEGTLGASFEYNTDLFEAATIERMAGHFRTLLESILADSSRSLSALPMLTPPERHQIAVEWNDTDVNYPSDLLLHQMFEAQAATRPDELAIISNRRRLTYDELERNSNQIAHWLKSRGARPNALVAVVMEKGWEQVAAVLGINKAGAAYLPLDAKLPRERLFHLLERGEAELALTQSRFNQSLDWPENITRLSIEDSSLACFSSEPLASSQTPTDLAYVIFTSGSTGLPKGVMIEHRGAVNTILDINDRFGLQAHDRILALSSLSFDLSVYDIFGTLAAGGVIVIPDAERAQDPTHWAELALSERVTVWNSVPALLQLFADYLTERPEIAPRDLRVALLSGDWVPLFLPDQIRRLIPGLEVTSLGGATEASIWSILYPIKQVGSTWKSIPYGRPMTNQHFYVLNECLEACPVGIVGQLHIGGIGLARGYWRDEEKTNASFIIHPHTGERLYRTGDLGRYLSDGNIEFLGRMDHQVKIRGFRIELGEIEAALSQHPLLREAVVIVREDTPSDKRLVAYFTTLTGQVPTTSELRRFIEGKLPSYMVPSAFVALKNFSLNSNGKVDRNVLPRPEQKRPQLDTAYTAPRTPVERDLAEIWSRVLGVEPVGIHDNFFEMGGDSILSIQIVAQAHLSGYRLRPGQIFEQQTIAKLSEVVGFVRSVEPVKESVIPSTPITSEQHTDFPLARIAPQQLTQLKNRYGCIEDIYPLSPMQQGMLFHSLFEPESGVYVEQLSCRLRGKVDLSAFKKAWQEVISRHAVLRTAFVWDGFDESLQVVLSPEQISEPTITEEDWGEMTPAMQAEALAGYLAQDRQRGFDLSAAPLMRVGLRRMSENAHQFIWSFHHLLLDGWSLPLVLSDLFNCYQAAAAGETVKLAPAPAYRDYIRWLQEQNLDEAEQYWRRYLAGSQPTLLTQLVGRAGSGEGRGYEEQELELSEAETAQVEQLARAEQVTINTVMQGAWSVLLSRYGGGEEVVYGATVAGRPWELAGVERMVGLFINTLAVRVRVEGQVQVGRWLQQLQVEQARGRQYEYSPLVEVQRWSGVDVAGTGGTGGALFDSILVFENYPVSAAVREQASSLKIEEVRFTEHSNFPLTVAVIPDKRFLLRIIYDGRRFDDSIINRMLGHLRTILIDMAKNPENQLSRLNLISSSEAFELSSDFAVDLEAVF